jgi:hypothetical protein
MHGVSDLRIICCRLWVPVLTIIAILLFNMLVVKKYVGCTLLSDGTHIRHRGEQPPLPPLPAKWYGPHSGLEGEASVVQLAPVTQTETHLHTKTSWKHVVSSVQVPG